MGQAVQSDWNAIENCTRSGLKKGEHKPLKKKKICWFPQPITSTTCDWKRNIYLLTTLLFYKEGTELCDVVFCFQQMTLSCGRFLLKGEKFRRVQEAKFSCLVFCVLLVICVRLRGIV